MEETIDIDQARADDPEALREALIDQFGYLVDEITALRTVVDSLPDAILNGRPEPGALSMKELYGAIATLDAEIRQARVDRIVDEEGPSLSPVDIDDEVHDAGWNERAIHDILEEVKTARRALTERLEDLPLDAWHHAATLEGETLTLFGLVHRMTKSDFQRLRDLGYRLHGAHLSEDDEPLPT